MPVGFMPPSHPVWLPVGGQVPLRPLHPRAQNLEGAARHRYGVIDTVGECDSRKESV